MSGTIAEESVATSFRRLDIKIDRKLTEKCRETPIWTMCHSKDIQRCNVPCERYTTVQRAMRKIYNGATCHAKDIQRCNVPFERYTTVHRRSVYAGSQSDSLCCRKVYGKKVTRYR
jgi:hypothetical protein